MSGALTVHMLSGNAEYDSQGCLTKLAAWLGDRCGIGSTLSPGVDRGTDLPGLEALEAADVMIVFCKRMTLPTEQLERIQRWCADGRGVVGIRTASHAFQTWLAFDGDVLGGSYDGHGTDESVRVTAEPGAEAHPILDGVTGWTRPGKVYRNPTLAPDATCLLRAADCAEAGQPLAWCRTVRSTGPGRTFYTSMGHPHDFENPMYLDLLARAIRWTAGRD